jgi:hypothetical protein
MNMLLLSFGSQNKFKKYYIRKPLHQRSYFKKIEAFKSLAIPEKLDGSFLMNWLFIRLDLRLNIVQFQKERYSRIQETELFLARPVPEKSET